MVAVQGIPCQLFTLGSNLFFRAVLNNLSLKLVLINFFIRVVMPILIKLLVHDTILCKGAPNNLFFRVVFNHLITRAASFSSLLPLSGPRKAVLLNRVVSSLRSIRTRSSVIVTLVPSLLQLISVRVLCSVFLWCQPLQLNCPSFAPM